MNKKQKERLVEKIEYDIKSDMIAQEEYKKIKKIRKPKKLDKKVFIYSSPTWRDKEQA